MRDTGGLRSAGGEGEAVPRRAGMRSGERRGRRRRRRTTRAPSPSLYPQTCKQTYSHFCALQIPAIVTYVYI